MTFPVAHLKIARVPCDSKTFKIYQWANEHVWQMFSHIYIRRLRYSARYNQLQKESFFAHKGSLYCCKISDKKLQFQCNVKTVSLYVKMPLRDFNSFSVFLMIFGSLRLHLFPAIFVKRPWSCSSVASHAGVFRGARMGREEIRAPLKTPAWKASSSVSLFFFSVSQWTCSNFCFP